MTETLVIRAADDTDIDGVLALYAQPSLDDGVVLPKGDALAILARFRRYPNYTLYVAEQGGAIVGTFALLVMDNIGHLGAPSAIVEDVAVDPARQGHGIGAAMMHFARDRARDADCYKLVLSSNAKRERAHTFYENLGFERHGYSFWVRLKEQAA